jgi:dTDP-glucose pyrophosphorylase
MVDYSLHLINVNDNIIEAFKKLNCVPINLTLFVLNDNNKLVGTLTDGDIRRGFLRGNTLNDSIEKFMTTNFISLSAINPNPTEIKRIKKNDIKLLPLVDQNGRIEKVIDFTLVANMLPVDAVVMAGGRGERLRPLTDKTPKPLLNLGNKPIIDYNIELIQKNGISNIFISVNYCADQIIDHFENNKFKNININYVKEDVPMGTIGSLKLIQSFKHDSILLMNADLFTSINLEEFYLHFQNSDSLLSIATIPYNVSVPYAVLEVENDLITSFLEKPNYTYHANAGIYIFKKELIELIPDNSFFNATDLMNKVIELKGKITYFPIIGYWIDIGKPEDYKKALEFAKHLI